MDFNNDTLLKLGRQMDISPVTAAIRQGLVVNPRGMEPVGVKGIFEAITGPFQHLISESTRRRTPWTRVFYPRRTTGPDGEAIVGPGGVDPPKLLQPHPEAGPGLLRPGDPGGLLYPDPDEAIQARP